MKKGMEIIPLKNVALALIPVFEEENLKTGEDRKMTFLGGEPVKGRNHRKNTIDICGYSVFRICFSAETSEGKIEFEITPMNTEFRRSIIYIEKKLGYYSIEIIYDRSRYNFTH
jgi:hypothetical protein